MIIRINKDKESVINRTFLQILEYIYLLGEKPNWIRIKKKDFDTSQLDSSFFYYDFDDKSEHLYILNISKYRKYYDIMMLLLEKGHNNTRYLVVPSEYVQINSSDLILVDRESYTTSLDEYEQTYNEVFSRYKKEIETTIINQTSSTKEIVNIQDCLSIRHLFLIRNTSYQNDYSTTDLNGYYINPNMATLLNGKRVTIDMLFELFGVDKDKLCDKLTKLKSKQLGIALIGLGGTMSNFTYFLNEMVEYFKIDNLFDTLVVYENDSLEISNLPRIPLDYITPIRRINSGGVIPKLNIFRNLRSLFKTNLLEENRFIEYKAKAFDFVIGSPDLATRTNMFNSDSKNFICPLHFNNELVIFENPKVLASDMVQETYGSIELTFFFLNMFRMTIELIDIMLKDELAINEKVFSFNSKESIDFFAENTKKSNYCYILS